MGDIQQKMNLGIAWMVVARLMDRSIGIVSTLILARLLVPGDFGLVAMATAIAGALDLLGAFSFDLALIQNRNAEKRHYNTVWTFNVLFGFCCGALLILLAAPAADFYRESRLPPVMYVLAASVVIAGFTNVGVVNFRKDLHFRSEFNFLFLKRVTTFVVTVGAAFTFQSYWALLIGMVVGRIAQVLISYRVNDYRPAFTLSAARELFHFSKWLLVNNALVFLLHDGCTFIVGRMFGATALGTYSIAYEISNLPSTELVAPINRVTFPGFSRLAEPADIAVSYLKLLGMIMLLIVPAGIGIAAVAEPLVLAALGGKWTDAIPLIQILALHGAITATQTNNGPVWMALGHTRHLTVTVLIFLSVLLPALYFLLGTHGLAGAGYAYLLAHVPAVPYAMQVTKRLLGFRWQDLAAVIWRPLVATAVMYFTVIGVSDAIGSMAPLPRLMLDVLCGIVVYALAIAVLWILSGRAAGAETFFVHQVRALLKR